MVIHKKHITFDLETLGNTYNAPIVQIGAAKFNLDDVLDTFIATVDIETLEGYGFNIDYSTLKWWFSQDIAAIKSVFTENDPSRTLPAAIKEFHQWIGNASHYHFWSHSTFDPVILTNNIKKCNLTQKIPFRQYRDIRTITSLTGNICFGRKREGVHHNALDDAIHQAKYLIDGMKYLDNLYRLDE